MQNNWESKQAYHEFLEDLFIEKLYSIKPNAEDSLSLVDSLKSLTLDSKESAESLGFYSEDEVSELVVQTIRSYFAAQGVN